MQTGNFSSSSFGKSLRTPSGPRMWFSDGLVFSVSEPDPDGHGEPAESTDMLGLGASERHFSCSSVIFRYGSSRFMRIRERKLAEKKLYLKSFADNLRVRFLWHLGRGLCPRCWINPVQSSQKKRTFADPFVRFQTMSLQSPFPRDWRPKITIAISMAMHLVCQFNMFAPKRLSLPSSSVSCKKEWQTVSANAILSQATDTPLVEPEEALAVSNYSISLLGETISRI